MKYFISTLIFSVSLFTTYGGEIQYHADVAPIFRDYCGGCHNESDYDGEFSIETYRAVLEGGESGETIITPGDISKSYLADLILKKVKRPMPPKREPQLSSEEVETITRWIAQGAKGPSIDKDTSILATLSVPEIKPKFTGKQPITAAAYTAKGRLAFANFGKVHFADRVFPHEGKIFSINFTTDGKSMVTASGITGIKGYASVWNTATGSVEKTFGDGHHTDILYDAVFSPDGKLIATAGYDRIIRIWDAETGKSVHEIEGHNGAIFDLAFSPDGTLLASASADETGKIWRVSDGERLDTLNQPEGEQYRIAFTPDGKYVLSAGADKKIRLWKVVSINNPKINPLLHARFAHEEEITEMTVSPDGQWLATASADRAIKIWSLPHLILTKSFDYQDRGLVSILRFADSQKLWIARMNGETEILELEGLESTSMTTSRLTMYTNRVQFSEQSETTSYSEVEAAGLTISTPAEISGVIETGEDTDDYRFRAKKGDTLVLETNAARSKSPLDSKIEVLTKTGKKIERVALQAVRDSWFTFRGKNSDTSDDFRVHNWAEMELNELLYADGEVVKLWHYPRGPDSGFRVYPGFGNRQTYFDTTPLSHPLGGPCYIVQPFAPGAEISPNGLPVFRLFWENDDSSDRKIGSDSRLNFVAPRDDEYIVRVSDVRGFGGDDYKYKLTLRPRRPDFSVSHNGAKLKLSPGSGREIEFIANLSDWFHGDIKIQIENLPAGFESYPISIQPEQRRAYLTIFAHEDAISPTAEEVDKIRITASAELNGKQIEKTVKGFEEFAIASPPKVKIKVVPDGDSGRFAEDGIMEISIRPGETVSAIVQADRIDFTPRIDFGKDDSGRNLPHGVYVDNIGLNGLMIPEGQSEQRFWITAAKWVPETVRMFHLQSRVDGKQTSQPIKLIVEK